jgi:peptidoglycan hydrolase-like protein with peptidoglycan-binding domain
VAALALCAAVLGFAAPAQAGVNPQLAGLQVALRAHGLYLGQIDGIMGPQTRAALKTFQRKKGLTPDGIAGKRTRARLGPLGHPLFGSRMLVPGRFGWDVSVLQFLLTRRGLYGGALDGYLGPETAKALRRYQRNQRLAADGVAGPRTLASLGIKGRVPLPARAVPLRRYVVRAGDNLTVIASRFGTNVRALASANKIDPAKPLLIGTKLALPGATATASSSSVREILTATARRYGVDERLVRALAWMESGYQTSIVSSAGAVGVMQTLPVTRDYVERVLVGRRIPRTIEGDVKVGVLYLRSLLRHFGGSERLALAAWYQGEKAVRERGVYKVSKPFVANVLALKMRV